MSNKNSPLPKSPVQQTQVSSASRPVSGRVSQKTASPPNRNVSKSPKSRQSKSPGAKTPTSPKPKRPTSSAKQEKKIEEVPVTTAETAQVEIPPVEIPKPMTPEEQETVVILR
jgi:hypothetical protein